MKDKPVVEKPAEQPAQNPDSGQASTPTEQPSQPEPEQPVTECPVQMFTIIDTGDSFYYYAFTHDPSGDYFDANNTIGE